MDGVQIPSPAESKRVFLIPGRTHVWRGNHLDSVFRLAVEQVAVFCKGEFMKQKKFLTVYAVLDEKTQNLLTSWQKQIVGKYVGTQTMDIPFHISIGSFPIESRDVLTQNIEKVCGEIVPFEVFFDGVNTFGNDVLFLQPQDNPQIDALRSVFDGNFADGFEFHPHTTIFCGAESDVIKAKSILESNFCKFSGFVTEIHLGEFFPTKILLQRKLKT